MAAKSIHTYLRVFLQVSNRIKIIIKILKYKKKIKKQFLMEDKSKIRRGSTILSKVGLVMKSLKNGKRVTNKAKIKIS